jgi:hypothetical protein
VAITPNAIVNPQIFSSAKNTNGFVITWTALLNRNYTVQWSGDLGSTNWTTLTNLTSTLPTVSVTDAAAPANTNRYYRIILNP